MSGNARGDRSTREEEEKNLYNPRSPSFCRACVDLSTYKKIKPESRKASPFFLDPKSCPLDKTSLGRATWALLHTMAAYYPVTPTKEEMKSMISFINEFSNFFPCKYCADDFKKNIGIYPPDVRSREAFSGWMCLQHNLVNKKTGKPLFDCSRVMERWRYGWADKSCDLDFQDI
ncbi:FAD-linked sulfhydryl oxidase ALR [Taenia solium]|eukprot:TsM_001173800 transcript=TsM_001173800 gene=TsM_001173800